MEVITVSLIGSAACAVLATALAPTARGAGLTAIVGFAVGALLGVVFLEILPQVLNTGAHGGGSVGALLIGILSFFLLEKLFVWRHHHGGQWVSEHDAHEVNASAPSAALVQLGNATHSLFDGMFIATTFLIAPRLGILSTIALFAHELAQQLGDAHTAQLRLGSAAASDHGALRAAALRRAGVAAAATSIGVIVGYQLLTHLQPELTHIALGFAGAGMMYVAMADLIPSLHQHPASEAAVQQIVLIAVGVGVIALLGAFF